MPPSGVPAGRWLLLIHSIPPKPDYFRVKIGRRLAQVGAVAIKNSVYVLPATEETMEDFQWILREIVDGGGEASICRSAFLDGLTDSDVERLFGEARARDYEAIGEEARALLAALRPGRRATPEQRTAAEEALAKLRKRFVAVTRIDFCGVPGRGRVREHVRARLDAIEARLRPAVDETSTPAPTVGRPDAREHSRGRTWVTRQGIFVDRIASAWLIRRFIDPEARFKFVPPQGYRPNPGELRFDMFEAEYTHEGDRCTFETLLHRFGLGDVTLASLAEIVHDIDLKDAKFGREDAVGIERVLAGIAAAHPDDAGRLERGAAVFDDLYALASTQDRAERDTERDAGGVAPAASTARRGRGRATRPASGEAERMPAASKAARRAR